ncbi:hypothetical protein BD770DRAFT_407429 [Pilaira anomala]|nr:hypothetical protein BD770DRAFT_407429 [Pilaira anomala]
MRAQTQNNVKYCNIDNNSSFVYDNGRSNTTTSFSFLANKFGSLRRKKNKGLYRSEQKCVSSDNIKYNYTKPKIVMDTRYHNKDAFDGQREQILPYELCTRDNEILLYKMQSQELIKSITNIWALTQFHDPDMWIINPGWYNWVILDIVRRINQLNNRNNPVLLQHILIREISLRLFFDSCPENNKIEDIPFNEYPIFANNKRARLILLAKTYGDSVCGLSEFIDFRLVLSMPDDEFEVFYHDLQNPKWNIEYRLQLMANLFTSSNPLGLQF